MNIAGQTKKIRQLQLIMETLEIESTNLERVVQVDIYGEDKIAGDSGKLLLVNDGQDLVKMEFTKMFENMSGRINEMPIIAAIHCGADRHQEYGMSVAPDFKGWGSKAGLYEKFVMQELMPLLKKKLKDVQLSSTGYAGFSLGALSAFDIAWNNPDVFSKVGVFSGSLWWRSIDKDDRTYDPWKHRMMHYQVAQSDARPGMKFFFECGEHDETEDRNRNGVIDSIDDTIDLMRLLLEKGYREGKDFYYLQIADGRHDVPSWAKAFPRFFEWMYR